MPPRELANQVEDDIRNNLDCAFETVKNGLAGFSFTNGTCKMKTLFTPTILESNVMVAVKEGSLTKFIKLPEAKDVGEVAKSLGFSKKVQFPDEESVRYFKHFDEKMSLWKCERKCLSHQGTLPLLYTKEHVKHLQDVGYISGVYTAIGLKFYQKDSKILLQWQDGSIVYKGPSSDYHVCYNIVSAVKPYKTSSFGLFKSKYHQVYFHYV